jgi:hypothetical protein
VKNSSNLIYVLDAKQSLSSKSNHSWGSVALKISESINNIINVSFESQGDFKYKIYRSDQPLSTPDACKGFSDAKEDNTVFPITPGTKLFILAANVDLENSSSFTVTVTPVTTSPNIKQQTPNGLQDLSSGVTLTALRGQTANTTLVFTNQGDIGSSMNYTIHPIGNNITAGVSVASIRNPVSTPSGTASSDVWNSSLFQTRTGTLRQPEDSDLNNGATQVEIPIQATCPDAQKFLSTTLEIVYSTGSMDDFDTPDNPNDDKPELEVFSVPVYLDCQGQQLTQSYLVKLDQSLVQWGFKSTEYRTPPDDYQSRCFNVTPTFVQASIPDLRGYFVPYSGSNDVLLTADGSKWWPLYYDLEGDDPSRILRQATKISNQMLGAMGVLNPKGSTGGLDSTKAPKVTYFYSLEQFKQNRVRAKNTYFSGTALILNEDGTVSGFGNDSYGQASGSGQPYRDGVYLEIPEPRQIPGLANIIEVRGAGTYALALSRTGDVWLWGSVPQCYSHEGLSPRIVANIN